MDVPQNYEVAQRPDGWWGIRQIDPPRWCDAYQTKSAAVRVFNHYYRRER